MAQARQAMGLAKKDHLRSILVQPEVQQAWLAVHPDLPGEGEIEALYQSFLPMQSEAIRLRAEMIPGTLEAVATMRQMGLRIGSTTGYPRQLMEVLVPAAAEAGYSPDTWVCPEDVPAGRPYPWMCYLNAMRLGIYPMAATCFRAPLEAVFHADPFVHISTFGGAEVGCLVAQKVLDISAAPAFLANVTELAELFDLGFRELKTRHGDVLVGLRQKGLMMGIELAHEAYGPLFAKAAFDHGLLSIYAGNYPRVAQLLPPLIIEWALVGEILERVDGALAQIKRMAVR
jgi:hypothetical protein